MKRKIGFLATLAMSIVCLVSCGEKEPVPKEPEIFEYVYRNLHVGEPTPIKGENLGGLEWDSSNNFVAEIDASQRIVPKHVGFAQIFGLGGLLIEVTPKYTDYDLPVICLTTTYEGIEYETYPPIFGVPPGSVRLFEKRSMDPRSDNSLMVYKTGNSKSPYVVYSFTDMKLQMSGTLIDTRYLSNLPDFLKERYNMYSVDLTKYSAYFYHQRGPKDDTKTDYIGGLQYSAQLGGVLMVFMPYQGTKALIPQDKMEVFARQLEEILTQ